MNAIKAVRVLPPDVYDTLEFSALAFGGIGGERTTVTSTLGIDGSDPVCAYGHIRNADCDSGSSVALWRADIDMSASDCAVMRINRRKGRFRLDRVSFQEWCEELGVVRGES